MFVIPTLLRQETRQRSRLSGRSQEFWCSQQEARGEKKMAGDMRLLSRLEPCTWCRCTCLHTGTHTHIHVDMIEKVELFKIFCLTCALSYM